jgi:hypothetical protein
MSTVNQDFASAPMGRGVVSTLVMCFGIVGTLLSTGLLLAVGVIPHPGLPGLQVILFMAGPLIALAGLVAKFLFERSLIARFRIEENSLVLGKKRYPLAGLVGIERDPEIMRWAFRMGGNGGLGAIRGHFWSKRSGKFEAFLTGTENAVVLRWPDKVVAVSPADPEFFIISARTAAGLG